MISAISYGVILLFQLFVIFIYFENALPEKKKTLFHYFVFIMAWAISLSTTLLWLPLVNLFAFILTVFFIGLLCYGAKIRSCIFHVFTLSAFLTATEFLVLSLSTLLFSIDLASHRYDDLTFMLQAALSKLLFFIVAYLAVKIRKKHERDLVSISILLALSLVPLLSIAFLAFLYQHIFTASYDYPFNTFLWISMGIALISIANMIIFFVYELTRRTHAKYTQIQLEQQREKISMEYYELLLERQESQKILIHDINKHLQTIQHIETASAEVRQYAASLSGEFGLRDAVAYSGNKYVDVIINRYAQACKENNIDFQVDIQGVSLTFMSDIDTTALLDNLLENAFEAAAQASTKKIRLSLHKGNQNYIVIQTQNSCNRAPRVHNGKIFSSKKNAQAHGIGLKSIHRIAVKYNGVVEWEYFEDIFTFEMIVALEQK
ncbi:MAG: GHKL domain-containing protein [Oscillospiraceae bacterium]|nr:GHKL domain-containing protein [Oscillospiraceae bacterium]